MGITVILAGVCIVLGLVEAVVDEEILMNPLVWFVLAIAFNTFGADYVVGRKRTP